MLDGQRRYSEMIRLARGLSTEHPAESRHYAQWLSAAIKSGNEARPRRPGPPSRRESTTVRWTPQAAGALWQARVRAHFEIQDLVAAQELAREALALTPADDHPTLLAHLAWSELGLGRLDDAEGHFIEAIEGDESLNIDLMGLSQVATLKGDPKAAIGYAERLNEQTGGSVWGRAKLVEALLRNGEQPGRTRSPGGTERCGTRGVRRASISASWPWPTSAPACRCGRKAPCAESSGRRPTRAISRRSSGSAGR